MNPSNSNIEQQGDLEAINALRKKFEAALVSNRPEELAPLITEDYVYYQPTYEGPSTYGRQFHLDYARSLPRVHAVKIKPVESFQMGRWAFETGEEIYQEEDGNGSGPLEQTARFARLLYRDDAGTWRMARTFRGTARDLGSYRLPPKPGFITNAGKGHWTPMPIDVECINDTRDLIASDREGLRIMMREEPATITLAQCVKRDPKHVFVSTQGCYTWADYENYQLNTNKHTYQYDEIYKFHEDARAIVPGAWGYTMGKGTGAVVSRETGVRRSGVQIYFYLWQRIDAGKDPWPWKIHSSFTSDLYVPISASSPDYPGKSNVIHNALQARWAKQPAERRNALRELVKKLESPPNHAQQS